MKFIPLLTLFLFAQLPVWAQTLTAQDICPAPGDSYRQYYCPYIDPGTNGIGVTWNLTGLNYTSNWVSTYTENTSQDHPESNLVLDPIYYFANQSKLEMVAGGSPDLNWTLSFSDPMLILSFPITDSYDTTDNFLGQTINWGVTYSRVGNKHIQFSGYGTLMTPAGTYGNTVRLKITQHEERTGDDGSLTIIDSERYAWYKAGIHHPLAEVISTYVNQGCETFSYYYKNLETASTEELTNQLTVFPVPTTDFLKFESDETVHSVKIVDLNGQEIFQSSFNQSESQIDVSGLEKGSYIAYFQTIEGKVITKHFIVI